MISRVSRTTVCVTVRVTRLGSELFVTVKSSNVSTVTHGALHIWDLAVSPALCQHAHTWCSYRKSCSLTKSVSLIQLARFQRPLS